MEMNNQINFKIYANNYDKHRKADLRLIDLIITNLNADPKARILDFGCGTGNYLNALQEKGYINLCGLDKSDDMCEIATEKTGVTIKTGSHFNIPYENNYFEGIILIDVIHFIPDIDLLFKELNRIAKNDGRIFIATQSHQQLETRIYSKYFPSTTSIDKLRHHEINKIVSTAELNGFTLVSKNDFLSNTDFLVDEEYFNLIKNKSFYILGLISEEEFCSGIEKLHLDLQNGNFVSKFPGRTIITLKK